MAELQGRKTSYRFENPETQKIYSELVQAGMRPANIDIGYCNINYNRSGPSETCLTAKVGDH